MRQLRMVLAVLLVFLGLGIVVDAVIDVAAQKEPIRGLAKLLMGGPIVASGWLLWRERRGIERSG